MTVAVVAGAAFVVVIVLLLVMRRTVRQLQRSIDVLRAETVPLLAELRVTVAGSSDELGRVTARLDTAESVSSAVDAASRLAYVAVSKPVIKGLAAGAGARRAAQVLRRSENNGSGGK